MALAEPAMLEPTLEDVVGPPLPPGADRAWRIFGELNATRASGTGGVGAITYAEMVAYETLTGVLLTPLDVALVREADAVFLQHALTRMSRETPPPTTLPED